MNILHFTPKVKSPCRQYGLVALSSGMREPDICKGVLDWLLKIKINSIEYTDLQKHISPFYSKKGVRLDIYAT